MPRMQMREVTWVQPTQIDAVSAVALSIATATYLVGAMHAYIDMYTGAMRVCSWQCFLFCVHLAWWCFFVPT
jgi:hypothetical protein